MGSGSSKESKATARPENNRHGSGSGQNASNQTSISQLSPQERQFAQVAQRAQRESRPDIPILGLIRGADNGQPSPDRPRETKPERELRKTEKERLMRLKERERSMREEHVDGGYLVTLGVYTGVEDYSKAVVRQLQIERRLAPFWKGLNDHSSSWTEAQLVAAARGLPIPEPDEIPPQMSRTGSQASSIPKSSDVNMNSLTVPIGSRSQSHDSGSSANISPSRPMFSSSGPTSPSSPPSSTAQLFRGRAKTLASLATGSKNHSPDLTPQEIKLPKDPNVNGQPLEAYLYKDASECPICFMYYPPYLNKTRCCDQAICSECFVQIKRPDPHPPEHEQPNEQRPPEEEAELLVSEVASCPFCVTPEFGITYDPPPFRRGLAYSKQSNRNPLLNSTSAMSSSSSINTNRRRRTTSISATAPQVITTDRVRPDWAKKLADARAHVLRRSAAATALHNATYVLGSQGDSQLRGLAGFRRRTSLFDTARVGASANGAGGLVLRAGQREGDDGNNDIYPARGSSRRTQVQDLEDLMMMEAIRLSLAAEEERKKKEDKEAKKDAKKKAKEDKKEAKQAEKLAKKGSASGGPMYNAGPNDSSSTWESNDPARSNSNLLIGTMLEEQLQGKGKAPAQDFAGFNPLLEPTSTLKTEMTQPENHSVPNEARDVASSPTEDAQRHLEESRAMLQPTATASVPEPSRLSPHSRQMSDTPSVASSINDSSPSSAYVDFDQPSATPSDLDVSRSAHGFASAQTDDSPAATPALEPMVNFRSLAAMIGNESEPQAGNEHVENAELASRINDYFQDSSSTSPPQPEVLHGREGARSRGDSGESNDSAPPPVYDGEGDQITPAPVAIVHDIDSKEIGNVNLLENVGVHQATQ